MVSIKKEREGEGKGEKENHSIKETLKKCSLLVFLVENSKMALLYFIFNIFLKIHFSK